MPDHSPLRILQLCSARAAIYGAVQSLMTLARAQRSHGHRVEFLTFAGKPFGAEVRTEGFKVQEVSVRGKIDPFAVMQMRSRIREGDYDVVHTHLSTSSVNGGLAARLARVPAIATVHGMSGKLSFLAANHLIAVSRGVESHLIHQGVKPDQISVVYNGMTLSANPGDRERVRAEFGMASEDIVVGTVSRITRMKGIETAVRAFALIRLEYPTAKYLVVGDGDGTETVQKLAQDLGVADGLVLAGYQTDVARYLAAMDLFLFPSLKEAMGIALVEAMGMGLPIVATDVGGIPEVVVPEVGTLVPVENPGRMATEAIKILADPVRRAEMMAASRSRARTVFSTETMASETDRVYRDSISRYRS